MQQWKLSIHQAEEQDASRLIQDRKCYNAALRAVTGEEGLRRCAALGRLLDKEDAAPGEEQFGTHNARASTASSPASKYTIKMQPCNRPSAPAYKTKRLDQEREKAHLQQPRAAASWTQSGGK